MLIALVLSAPAEAAWQKGKRGRVSRPEAVQPEAVAPVELDKVIVLGMRIDAPFVAPVPQVEFVASAMPHLDIEYLQDEFGLPAASVHPVEVNGRPQQISVRGLSYGMNQSTLDGASIASVGNGGGERGAWTQTLPMHISARTRIERSFNAEMDGAVIGGMLNVTTRSAMSRDKPWTRLNGWGSYGGYEDAALSNASDKAGTRFGGGFGAGHARRFGAQEQFGLVLSLAGQQVGNNGGRLWQDRKGYYSDEGGRLGEPDHARGWNGIAAPLNFGYGSFPKWTHSAGAAAKLEWQPAETYLKTALLWFGNRREEASGETSGVLYVADSAASFERMDASGGSARLDHADIIWTRSRRERDNEGVVATLEQDADGSRFELLASWSQEDFRAYENRFLARTDGMEAHDLVAEYVVSDLPQVAAVTIQGRPATDAFSGLPYVLVDANATQPSARATLADLRANYARNADADDDGLGFVVGAELRRSSLWRDVQRAVYEVGSDVGDWLYDPRAASYNGQVWYLPWLDGRALAADAEGELGVNAGASALQSVSGDFGYDEDLQAAYVSSHYVGGKTSWLLGLRYDRVAFDARTAMIRNGAVVDPAMGLSGDYTHWLPSFGVRRWWDEDTQLRFSFSRTLGRPNPSSIAAAQFISCSNGSEVEDDERCTLTRGNPQLRPQRADNLDLDLQHRFAGSKLSASLGWFHKIVRDNIFTLTSIMEIDGVEYSVRQPVNLEQMTVQGIELMLRRSELALGDQVFDFNVNATWMRGETIYATDAGTRHVDQLVGQPTWMANAALNWRLPKWKGRMSLGASARGDVITRLGGFKPWEDSRRPGFVTANWSLSHRVGKSRSLSYSIENLTGRKSRYVKGDVYRFARQYEDYGRRFVVNLVWEQ